MEKIKAAIIYYSATGANYQLARWAEEGAVQAGAEARLRKVEELAPRQVISSKEAWRDHSEKTSDVMVASMEDLEWADVIIFSAPTRFGNLPSQMKQFLDQAGPLWKEGKLANKVVTGMSSAEHPHGGQEATILSLYTTMYHWGAIVVAPGYTNPDTTKAGGNPYGTSTSVNDIGTIMDDVKEAVLHQVKRACRVGLWIHLGSRNHESIEKNEYSTELIQS
jgi:NAD(P)H dehydrogenase (quinone)